MITITNNKETKTVTKGAYNSFYKPLGFTVIEDKKNKNKEDKEKTINDEVTDKQESVTNDDKTNDDKTNDKRK